MNVLKKKVSADPVLLEFEADGVDHGLTAEKNGSITEMKLNQDSPSDGYQEFPKSTIIDTSLVEGEEPFNVWELRNLPADANISFVLSRHSSNMVTVPPRRKMPMIDYQMTRKIVDELQLRLTKLKWFQWVHCGTW